MEPSERNTPSGAASISAEYLLHRENFISLTAKELSRIISFTDRVMYIDTAFWALYIST